MATASVQFDRQTAPATKAAAVTPSDSTVVSFRAIYVGVVGNLAVRLKDDATAVTFVGVPAGTLLPLIVDRVMATGTTATSIVGLI